MQYQTKIPELKDQKESTGLDAHQIYPGEVVPTSGSGPEHE